MKILLAMSGGVDSSVVAHLLKEQGHDVIGVRFTLWTDPLAPALAKVLPSKCCTTQNIARADAVAKALNIPLQILDLEEEFKETVVDPYLQAHSEGLTPNPCIGCNRTIKFGKLLELAKGLGCERLATGHYARVAVEEAGRWEKRWLLLEAIDKKKDQSYYLYTLSQEQLSRVLFPLGAMQKSEVYALAKRYGIPLPSSYRESQDLCFFPEKKPSAFLKRHLSHALTPGKIVRKNGTIVGTHQGLPLYTLGQRRGLRIGGLKIPLEVISKNTAENTLIVDECGKTTLSEVVISDLRFISWIPESSTSLPFECRTRSLSPKRTGKLFLGTSKAIFAFDDALPPQSPGQSLVLYRGDEVVGGGVII